jgi:hypothetical protein
MTVVRDRESDPDERAADGDTYRSRPGDGAIDHGTPPTPLHLLGPLERDLATELLLEHLWVPFDVVFVSEGHRRRD